ncbi:MAG: phage portal protein, partial [Pseudomonadota bacterium]
MGFSIFGRASAPEQIKASATAPLMAFHGTGRAVWSPRDHGTLTRNGYESNAIGFRAVRMVAEASAAVPLVLSEGGARMVAHPVASLLE